MFKYKFVLLQIYQWVCRRKNFENRLSFGEFMGKSLVSCSFWLAVYMLDILVNFRFVFILNVVWAY